MLTALLTALFSLSNLHAASPGDVNAYGADFERVPSARTVEESKATFDARARLVLETTARPPQPVLTREHGLGFHIRGNSKLALGIDVAEVNKAILDPNSKVYARVGSDFQDVGFLCRRTGDYDFALRGLTLMAYRHKDKLWPEARQKLVYGLMNQTGNKPHFKNFFWLCGVHEETENHILMTEGSRLLTNQLRYEDEWWAGRTPSFEYDNEANGMNDWMLRHMQGFLRGDFSEYNSRPYQAYTVMAVQNIAELAEEPRVKLIGEMVMHYLDAKFAVSSNGLRRSVPFRRQKVYKDATDVLTVDRETPRFVLMAGNTQRLAELKIPYWFDAIDYMVPAAIGKYRVPDLILDLVIDKKGAPYFQRFHHTGIEMYSSSDSFLISAGGIFINKFDMGTGQNDGWAIATTLMPTAGGIDSKDFIRIDGHRDDEERVNTCVAPGFACGLNPVVPAFIPEECRETLYNWTFLDFTAEQCPLKYGFHAAVYDAPCDGESCETGAERWGFFEAAEPTISFKHFRDRILAWNGPTRFRSDRDNVYRASDGREIVFRPIVRSKYEWGIRRATGLDVQTDLRKWPLAQGEIMQAAGDGLVVIRNPRLKRELILDARDALNPKREERSF